MSDEQLVELGTNEALDELCKRWKRRLCGMVNGRAFVLIRRIGFDDALQIAYVALIQGAKDFKAEMGIPLGGFLHKCVLNRLYDATKATFRQRSCSNFFLSNISLDAPIPENKQGETFHKFITDDKQQPEKLFLFEEFQQELLKKCTEFERQVLELRTLGFSYNEIAEITGEGFKPVDNAKQRVRRKALAIMRRDQRWP